MPSILQSLLLAVAAVASVHAWTLPTTMTTTSTSTQLGASAVSRQDMLKTVMGGAFATVILSNPLPAFAETTAAGVQYEVVKAGDGPRPDVGELVAIRFKAYAGSTKIDDIFDTPEPYYTRLGSGGLIKGVETTLPLMRLGDRWKLTIPVSLI
jgi:FKBP-type peptidyl-prolyl cis-trans isomerase